MPKVSVVIPSYNHAKFINLTIQSVLDQSFQDFEILITDDGSSDGTPDVVRTFRDPRIELDVFPANRGACVAMNSAIARARGEYIAVLNSDDCFLAGKLKKQVAILDRHSELAAVFSRALIIDERGSPLPSHPLNKVFGQNFSGRAQWLRSFFYNGNSLCHPTILIRRSCYDELGPYDPRLRQLPDFDYWVRFCSRFDHQVIPEQLTAFRILDDSRNVSAERPDTIAATMWEFRHVLPHYLALDDELFGDIFKKEIADLNLANRDRRVQLGYLTLGAAYPSHHAYGLDLLYDAVTLMLPGITARELNTLSGKYDPYGATTKQALIAIKKSTFWRMTKPARRAVQQARTLLQKVKTRRKKSHAPDSFVQ
ncbi:MAG: glycosyltransferase [Hyphomicrobiaceae bacterium]